MLTKTYYWYKSQGICPKCRTRPVEEGKSCCRECLDRINEHQKKRIKEGVGRMRYRERRNRNVCVVCGRTLCRCSKTRCGYHQMQEDAYNRKTRDPDDYIGIDGSAPAIPAEFSKNNPRKPVCNGDCFNCKFEDCIKA